MPLIAINCCSVLLITYFIRKESHSELQSLPTSKYALKTSLLILLSCYDKHIKNAAFFFFPQDHIHYIAHTVRQYHQIHIKDVLFDVLFKVFYMLFSDSVLFSYSAICALCLFGSLVKF